MEQSSPVERACTDSLQSTQKAQTWIRNGWIAALFSAFVTLLLALAGATGTPGLNYNLWNLLDVFLITVLAFGIYQRSRVAATSMFVYFLVSKIGQWVHSASVIGIGGGLVFVYLYLQAMRGTFRLSPPLKVNRPLAFSLLLAFLSLSLALVNGPVWREGQSKKVPPLSWEEFVATDLYKELSPEKKAEARQRYKEIYGQTVAEWTAGLPDEQSVEAEKLFVRGGAFLLAEDYAKALSYFKQVVQINPRHAKAWVSVGFCSDKLGRYQEEITALQQAIRLQPDLAGAPLSLGRALGVAYGKLRRYQEARATFQQADPPSA